MDEQPLNAGILGFATRRMCGSSRRRKDRWALTPPFSPLAAPAEGGRLFSVTLAPDVAAGFPLEMRCSFVARTFLFMLAHRATDLISVFCKVTEIFPDVQIGRANSDTFDGEKCRSHSRIRIISVSFYLFLSIFKTLFSPFFLFSVVGFVQYVDNQGQDSCRGAAGGVDAEMVIGGMSPAAVGEVIVV